MGRRKGQTKEVMEEKKKRALNLIDVNPTLSIQRVADHFEVSASTVSKWFDQAGLKRWTA
jgi:transposase-like protein